MESPEKRWFGYDFLLGARPIFRGELLVLGRVAADRCGQRSRKRVKELIGAERLPGNDRILAESESGSKIDQWIFQVPAQGGRWHTIPQLAVYTTYIPLINCLLGCYMLPTTF